MTVGERVRARRLELGLTQRDLDCDEASYSYISRIEKGTRQPSVKALRVLAVRLDTTVHWLETGQPDPLDQCRERCRQLIEIAREERRRTRLWKRRCEALGGDLSAAEMEGLAEMLHDEVRRLRGLQAGEAARGAAA